MKSYTQALSLKGPVCPYCGALAVLISSEAVYGGRDYGPIWFCDNGHEKAWVGCHPDTYKPLGTPADAETRNARKCAHAVFDPLWKTGEMKRTEAYGLAASILHMTPDQAHIGLLTANQCIDLIKAIKDLTEDD